MATSKLEFYSSTVLLPEKNAIFDIMNQDVLGSVVAAINDFQYMDIKLTMSIKVPWYQSDADFMKANVCVITQDNKKYYFFIKSAERLATETVKLNMVLDVLNTYKQGVDYVFTNRTKIKREHKNRFRDTSPVALRDSTIRTFIVDQADEGIQVPIKYKYALTEYTDFNSTLNQLWYLQYISDADNEKAPIKCQLYPQLATVKVGNVTQLDWTWDQLEEGVIYYFYNINDVNLGAKFTVDITRTIDNSDYYGFAFWRGDEGIYYARIQYKSGLLSKAGTTVFVNKGSVSIYSTNANSRLWRGPHTGDIIETNTANILALQSISASTGSSIYARSFADMPRSNSRIIKIIECPYCPINITFKADGNIKLPQGWSLDYLNTITLTDLTVSMEHTFGQRDITQLGVSLFSESPIKDMHKDKKYEPKLYHSSLYTYKLAYDSFSFEIPLENVKCTQDHILPTMQLLYKQSDNINSTLMLKPIFTNASFSTLQDYPVLVSTRNNEVQTYNSAYQNYKRTDLQYDQKLQSMQIAAGWIGTGISSVASIGSFAASAATGGVSLATGISLTSSTISSIASNVYNSLSREVQMEAKLANLRSQATSISGSDDLSVFKAYSGNLAFIYTYKMSKNLENAIYDLFFKTGYISNRIGVPDLTSRYRFNFCQCEADIISRIVYPDIVQEIKDRFMDGVTVFHNKADEAPDVDYVYENWEASMI